MIALRILLLTTGFIAISFGVFAQDVEAKVDAFNAAIGKEYNVSNKGSKLIIEGFREGKQIKVDKVNIFDLDLKTLKFSEKDRAVSVKCYSEIDGCVNRVLMLNKKKSYRQRIVFAVSNDVSGEEIVTKLKLLLNAITKKH